MLKTKDQNVLWIGCANCENKIILQDEGKREAGRNAFQCGKCMELCVLPKHIKGLK